MPHRHDLEVFDADADRVLVPMLARVSRTRSRWTWPLGASTIRPVGEPKTKPNRADVLMYGTALALALVGAAVAVGNAFEVERVEAPSEPVAPQPAAPPEEPPPEARGPVPELPSVPDLRTEPPPARPAADPAEPDDPRFAELGAEMRYLSRARQLLTERPAEALAVLEQHRRAHPRGAFREEREAFAIEALVATGARDGAERRYYDFQRDFPGSSFTSRLETLMR
jgi:hypothetical protein